MILRGTLTMCALAALTSPTQAAQPTDKAVDADLLEFLGSFDADEEGWIDYLEQTPVRVAGKTPVNAATPPGVAKQVKGK